MAHTIPLAPFLKGRGEFSEGLEGVPPDLLPKGCALWTPAYPPRGTPDCSGAVKSWDNEETVNRGGSRRPTTAELTSRCQQVIYEHLPDKRTGV